MVRPVEDSDLVPSAFVPRTRSKNGSKKSRKGPSVIHIPGLCTPEHAKMTAYLDAVNLTFVYVDIWMPHKRSPLEHSFTVYGATSIGELAVLIRTRLTLEATRPMNFMLNGDLVFDDVTVSQMSNKYVSSDGFTHLSCSIGRKQKIFNVDKSVKIPIVEPVTVCEECVPFPPFRIRSVCDAKEASRLAKGGGTYGRAFLVYGSFGDGGSLQF